MYRGFFFLHANHMHKSKQNATGTIAYTLQTHPMFIENAHITLCIIMAANPDNFHNSDNPLLQ